MSVSLVVLIDALQANVPARDGVPTAAQYEDAVRRAVRDYSQRRSLPRSVVLNVTRGQADYALPADFLHVIRLERLWGAEGVLHSAEGLVPVPVGFRERYSVAGLSLTFYPTPTYTLARRLFYAAGHVLDESDAYPDMTDADAAIVALKAQALALRAQAHAVAAAGEMVEYQIGDERVKRADTVTLLSGRAESAEAAYEAAVRAAIGPQGAPVGYQDYWDV